MADFEKTIFDLIESYSGLEVNEAHRSFMCVYIKKRMQELSVSEKEFLHLLKSSEEERTLLINEAAINETYFFREEQQFDFLKEHYLPQHLIEEVVIWSAACSTGEEALSLYALSHSMGIKTEVYATDIDTAALKVIDEGLYSTNSFRSDGKKYISLLDTLGLRLDGIFELSDECRAHIHTSYLNLSNMESLPVAKESVNIIFLRNVFIYFDIELRKKIIRTLAGTLKNNGLLFLSVNEIASVECEDDVPLVKEHSGSVYYFRKVDLKTKKLMTAKKPAQKEEKPKVHDKGRENFNRRMNEIEKDALIHSSARKTISSSLPEDSSATYTSSAAKNFTSVKSSETQTKVSRTGASKTSVTQNKGELPQDIKDIYSRVLSVIDTGNMEKAEAELKAHNFRPEQTEHKLYMEALISNGRGKNRESASLLEKAFLLNPNFWPASFQLGMLQVRMGLKKEGKKTLSSCIKSLKDYIKEEKICYNAIVEQFSPAYFLTLCENYVKILP